MKTMLLVPYFYKGSSHNRLPADEWHCFMTTNTNTVDLIGRIQAPTFEQNNVDGLQTQPYVLCMNTS